MGKVGRRSHRNAPRALQIGALEKGIEPDLIGGRIAELRRDKEDLEANLRALGSSTEEVDGDELLDQLERLPDLGQALREAAPKLKGQVFEAFCLEIRFDKLERRVEISATVSEEVAKAFENTRDLLRQVPCVTPRDIAAARFVAGSDARVVERMRLSA